MERRCHFGRPGAYADRLLGRLNSAVNTVSWGAIPIGAAVGGLLARSSLRLPYLLGAVLLLAMALLALRLKAQLSEDESGRQRGASAL